MIVSKKKKFEIGFFGRPRIVSWGSRIPGGHYNYHDLANSKTTFLEGRLTWLIKANLGIFLY